MGIIKRRKEAPRVNIPPEVSEKYLTARTEYAATATFNDLQDDWATLLEYRFIDWSSTDAINLYECMTSRFSKAGQKVFETMKDIAFKIEGVPYYMFAGNAGTAILGTVIALHQIEQSLNVGDIGAAEQWFRYAKELAITVRAVQA